MQSLKLWCLYGSVKVCSTGYCVSYWSTSYLQASGDVAAQCYNVVCSTNSSNLTLQYHYKLIGLKRFNMFPFTTVILFDAQIVHILASGSQFNLVPEFPTQLE